MKFIFPCSVYYWNSCCVLINIFGKFLMKKAGCLLANNVNLVLTLRKSMAFVSSGEYPFHLCKVNLHNNYKFTLPFSVKLLHWLPVCT